MYVHTHKMYFIAHPSRWHYSFVHARFVWVASETVNMRDHYHSSFALISTGRSQRLVSHRQWTTELGHDQPPKCTSNLLSNLADSYWPCTHRSPSQDNPISQNPSGDAFAVSVLCSCLLVPHWLPFSCLQATVTISPSSTQCYFCL